MCAYPIAAHNAVFLFNSEVDAVQLASRLPPVPPLCDHTSCDSCWTGYPQSRFPNWTKDQVSRSKISDAIVNYRRNAPCIIYRADVRDDGFFENVESMTAYANGTKETWDQVIHTNVRGSLLVVSVLYSIFLSALPTFIDCDISDPASTKYPSSSDVRREFIRACPPNAWDKVGWFTLHRMLLVYRLQRILDRTTHLY